MFFLIWKKVSRFVQEQGFLAGKSPITLVAACLYFVSCLSTEPKLAKEIADIAGCSEGTLKNAYKLLWEVKKQISSILPSLPLSVDKLPIA